MTSEVVPGSFPSQAAPYIYTANPSRVFSMQHIEKGASTSMLLTLLNSVTETPLSVVDDKVLRVSFEKSTELKSATAIQALFELIRTHPSLVKIQDVQFINCKIGASPTEAILAGLNSTDRIDSLSFHSCIFDIPMFFQVPQPFHSKLQTLEISNQQVDMSDIISLGFYLGANPCPPLKRLYLVNDALKDAHVIELSERLMQNTSLVGLYLGLNNITDAGIVAIAWMIEEHPTLAELSLQDNKVGNAGAMVLGKALHKRKTVFNLGLEQNAALTTKGAEYLVEKGQSLQTLGLSNVKQLKTLGVLEKAVKRTMQAMSLSCTGVRDEDVRQFTSKRSRTHADTKMELFVSRTHLRPESITALRSHFEGTGVKVTCDPITSDDSRHAALIDTIVQTARPEQRVLDQILAVQNPSDCQALFGLFLNKIFDTVEIDKDGDCLFNSIAESLMDTDYFMANKFLVDYLVKYQNDFQEILQTFDKMTLGNALRRFAVHYIERNRDNFLPFLSEEDFDDEIEDVDPARLFELYCSKMKQLGTYGGDKEIQAIMGLFEEFKIPREIIVLDPSKRPQISHEGEFVMPGLLNRANPAELPAQVKKIHLSYTAVGLHYNLLVKK